MSRYVFKLPDLGEGTVEAEIVAWHVKPGDTVAEEDVIVEVMTDKASVEVPAPVSGRVLSTTGVPGDMVPVGAELIAFETDVGAAGEVAPTAAAAESPLLLCAARRQWAETTGAAPSPRASWRCWRTRRCQPSTCSTADPRTQPQSNEARCTRG